MKKYPALLLILAVVFCFAACSKKGSNPQPPFINLLGMSKDSIYDGDEGDTVALQIYIKDANGDLASEADCFFMDDKRDDTEGFLAYTFPKIDEAILNNPNGIEGDIFFFITGDRAVLRDDSLHQATGDTVVYEIYVTDKAGNASEHITLPPIYIKP